MFFISQASRTSFNFLSAIYKFFLEFRGVCKVYASNWSAVDTSSCAERWELGFPQVHSPGLRTAVSPVYTINRRAYVHPLSSVEDPPPVPLFGQFARCSHQRFLCLKRLLLTQTRIRRA